MRQEPGESQGRDIGDEACHCAMACLPERASQVAVCSDNTHPPALPILVERRFLGVFAQWAGPAEIKRQFGGTVDFVADNRAIFDLGGNEYRLIVHISFEFGRVLVKFIGTMPNTTASIRRPCHGEENDPSNSYRN